MSKLINRRSSFASPFALYLCIAFRALGCLLILLTVCLPLTSAKAQGRPDTRWMRGGAIEVSHSSSLVWSPDGTKVVIARLFGIDIYRAVNGSQPNQLKG